MDRDIWVYADVQGRTAEVGRLWWRSRKGRESMSFEYARQWLAHPQRFSLEPALALVPGTHHASPDKAGFGAFGDSAPDRWGRNLLRRAERRRASQENRAPRTLFEIDVLLGVDDETRQGALRFAAEPGGPFLAEPTKHRVPPLVGLPRLLSAAKKITADTDDGESLSLLMGPGSSLGGARPKASVRDADGMLLIAKFPHQADNTDMVRWESVALALAAKAGLEVPAWRLEKVADQAVLVMRRFDRQHGRRIPFLSAMGMLGATDREPRSYLEIAEALRRYGAAVEHDLGELWRRVVFNVLISNTDDHLRNHGFLRSDMHGWRLSPAYDLNPTPTDLRPRVLATHIDRHDGTASLALAMETARHYGLGAAKARRAAGEIAQAVAAWRAEAARLGLDRHEMERMASAFQHADLEQALKLS